MVFKDAKKRLLSFPSSGKQPGACEAVKKETPDRNFACLSNFRSNSSREVGFLSESRRLNVAVTRARRHLTLVCDSTTVGAHAFIQSLVDHAHDVGDVVSAQEWVDQGLVSCGTGGGGGGDVAGTRSKKLSVAPKSSHGVEPQKSKPKSSGIKQKEPNATVIAATLLESKGNSEADPIINSVEADPWSYLKLSVDSFIEDKSENEFLFSESLSAKGKNARL